MNTVDNVYSSTLTTSIVLSISGAGEFSGGPVPWVPRHLSVPVAAEIHSLTGDTGACRTRTVIIFHSRRTRESPIETC